MGLVSKRRRRHIRPTPKILLYFAIDMAGLFTFGTGAMYLTRGKAALGGGTFPSTTAEAAVCTLAGIVVMFWGAAHMLREMAKQVPDDAEPGIPESAARDQGRPASREGER